MSSGGLEVLTLILEQMNLESAKHQESTNQPLLIASVSGSIFIINEGNVNYHLQRGGIRHEYVIDEKREYATCQCGRLLHYR